MIQETTTYTCRSCGSANIIKNGTNKCGNPQYHCKDCGVYRVLKPQEQHSATTRQQVLKAAQERVSLRGIERVFNVCRQTVAKWIQAYVKQLPVLADTLLLYEVGDVLEIDELWSFVLNKDHNCVRCTPMGIQPMWVFCLNTYIGQWKKAQAQHLIWNAGTIPYGSD